MQAGTWNKMSYQENTWYIPGIFNVYIRYLPVDKEVIPVAGLAPASGQGGDSGCRASPLAFYSTAALYPGLCLTCSCVSPIFSRDIPVIIFNPLNLLNL